MEQEDYLELSEDGKTVISCQKDYQGAVVIPDSVTEIGDEAFWGCENLTSIEIPKGVEVIRENTFAACTSLTSVEIPDSVTQIRYRAFSGCTSLTSIKIPDSVKVIEPYAFAACTSLKKIIVDKGNPNYCSRDGVLYSKDMSILVAVPGARKSFVIPDSVTLIGYGAFILNESLTSIEIPSSVNEIGVDAFVGCTSLKEIIVDEGNQKYRSKDSVLYSKDMSILVAVPGARKSFVIPDSVIMIGNCALFGCENLISIEIPNSVTEIGRCAFDRCENLTSIKIPDSVTEIGDSAFFFCSSLIEVHLQHKTPIDLSNAFRGNHKTNVTIYVPKGTGAAYRNCEHYKDFKEIIEE